MKVRTQLMLILLAVIVSIIALSVWLKLNINRETVQLLRQNLADTRDKDVPEIIRQHASEISSYAYYYSAWDQMVDFVAGKKNAEWARQELDNAVSNHRIDYIWITDSKGDPYYTSSTNPNLPPVDLPIAPPMLTSGLHRENFRSFFLKFDTVLVEIYAAPVQPTEDKERASAPKGYLLLGRVVDSMYLSAVRSLSKDIGFSLSHSGASEEIDPENGSLYFNVPLRGFDGKAVASFTISRSYPLINHYHSYLKRYLFAFLLIVAIIGLLFFYVAQVLLLKPLSSLSTALKQYKTEKLSPYNKKKNEFGALSRLITRSFLQNKRLQEEIETRKRSEAELFNALKEKEEAQTEKVKAEEFLGQQQAILKLHSTITELGFDDIIRETIAHAAKTINCERVGIWLYDDDNISIASNYVYRLSAGDYAKGGRIYEKDYPDYFKGLKKDILIIADDALTNPATTKFAENYLVPQGITSMMDVPVRSGDHIIGIICFEHVGVKREWTVNEQVFARSIADIIAISFERKERSKAEAELYKSQVRFEETQELANIGSWEFNFFTKDIVWSKEMYRIFDLVGAPAEKLVGLYRKRLHPDDIPVIRDGIKSLVKNKGTHSVEARIVSRNGTIKYILAIGEVIKGRYKGGIAGLRGTVQDITKQKQAALAKSEFLSCMSHEIRTPINGVVGIANLLMEEEMTEKQKEYVKTLNFSAQHLATVVSDILDFSKIESGHMVFERVSFNLEKNCQYVFNLFAQKAAEKNIAFNFIPSPIREYSLYGDYVRLNQVLSNLLSNAIKFTNAGQVDFSYTIEEECGDKVKVSFSVKDTGIGIPEHNQKQIFESFTQADESITRQYGGTGLGLTISKKLVELQGGIISVKSIPGKGSEFIVELSFDKHVYKEETLPVITTAEKNQNKDLAGMRILVAEDNNVNAMVLTRFLTKWNIESKVARDGQEALNLLQKEQFDIVLMDIQMPNVDGIEATKIIRQSADARYKDIMLVAFTADASVDTHRELLKIGFNHCITKPFNPEILFSFLKKNYNAA